jgi:hypothetical protein
MLTSHELFGFMSPALANDILAFTFESDKPTYRAIIHGVAEARKVRPVFLERQPRAQRHSMVISMLARPGLETVASTLIRTWLVKKERPMLVDFLNAMEIKNQDGVVDDLPKEVMEPKADIALIGLAVMGQNLILNMNDHGFTVVAFNRTVQRWTTSWPTRPRAQRSSARIPSRKWSRC